MDDVRSLMVRMLNRERFTVLFSGGKDSLATLLWVYNHVNHRNWNVVYVEVTGNTHPDCTAFVEKVCNELDLNYEIRGRSDDFFDWLIERGVPGWGKRRWCLRYFKIPFFKRTYRLQVVGMKARDSYFRSKRVEPIRVYHSVKRLCISPIWDWTTGQVLDYIREQGFQLNPCYDRYFHSGNCMFCPFHNKRQIQATLRDPYWRHKIHTALQKLPNPPKKWITNP